MRRRRTAGSLIALNTGLLWLFVAACTPALLPPTPPGPGIPRITAFEIIPPRIDDGCPVTFRIDFTDSGADITRAIMRWRVRTVYPRHHEGVEAIPITTNEIAGRNAGHAEVTIVPPHAGAWIYRIQLEDAQGQTSNVAEAQVDVTLLPFWRRARCDSQASAPS